MTTRQVAFRLKSEGKAEVLRDAGEVKSAFVGAYDASAAAAEKATAASERQERSFRAMAAAARDSELQSRNQRSYNQILGVDAGSGKSARDSAALFEEQAAAMEKAEARAARIRGYLDPAGVALENLNDELRENIQLEKMGLLSTEQLAQAQRLAKTRFDETTLAIENQNKGLTKRALAGRLNLARQGADVLTTGMMGMNPGMIAIQQGPQILDALGEAGIKATPALIGLGAAVGVAAGAVIVLGKAWLDGEEASLALQRAVTGLGRTAGLTAGQLDDIAKSAADQADISVAAARDQAEAYVSTGKIGGEVMKTLIELSRDYAALNSKDLPEATQMLAKGMAEPDKMARELTRTMGLLDQKTLDHIDTLIELGKRDEAQAILADALKDAVAGQADKVDLLRRMWEGAATAVSNYWTKLSDAFNTTPDEELATLNRSINLDRQALPHLSGGQRERREAMIQEMEARRTELTNAANQRRQQAETQAANQRAQEAKDRKDREPKERGPSAASLAAEAARDAREKLQRDRREEDVQAQRDQQIAQALGDTDRLATLKDEETVRRRVRDLIDDGKTAAEAQAQADRERAPLIEAEGVAMQRMARLQTEAASTEADRIAGLNRFVAADEHRLELAGRISRYEEIYKDKVTATTQAKLDQFMIDKARADVMAQINREAEAEHRLTLARLSGDTDEERRLSIEDRISRRARDIEARGKLNRGEGDDQAMSEIQEELNAEALGARRSWIKGLLSDLRDGDIGDLIAHQLERATDKWEDKLTDMLAKIDWSSMFGGSKGDGGFGDVLSKGFNFFFGKNASGTDFWDGGPTWVGERGPELLNLPRGSKITEHDRAMRTAFASPKGAGGLSLALTYAPVNTISGGASDEVRALLARQEAEFRGKVIATVADAKARFEL